MSARVRSWVKYIQPLHLRHGPGSADGPRETGTTPFTSPPAGRRPLRRRPSDAQPFHRPGRVHLDVVRGPLQQLVAEVGHRPRHRQLVPDGRDVLVGGVTACRSSPTICPPSLPRSLASARTSLSVSVMLISAFHVFVAVTGSLLVRPHKQPMYRPHKNPRTGLRGPHLGHTTPRSGDFPMVGPYPPP